MIRSHHELPQAPCSQESVDRKKLDRTAFVAGDFSSLTATRPEIEAQAVENDMYTDPARAAFANPFF